MKTLFSYALAVCGAVAILAGCSGGGSGSPSSALGSTGLNATQPGALALGHHHDGFMGLVEGARHPDHQKSWRSPELKKDVNGRQLWISDPGTNDVYIYNMPSLTLVATLTGFDQPQGECSDSSGDVWVTNTGYKSGNHVIYEYSHDAVLMKTLTDSTGLPVGCAWDKTTGNLAVTNIFDDGPSQPPGEVVVYPLVGSGAPTTYQDPDSSVYAYFSAGYDGRGNLYFDVAPYAYTPAYVDKLPKGGTSVHRITISGTIHGPGAVQWIASGGGGPYLMVEDDDCSGSDSPITSCIAYVDKLAKGATSVHRITISSTIHGPGSVQWIPTRGGGNLAVEDDDCSGSFSPITSCIDYVTISHSAGTINSTTNLNNSLGVAACSVSQVVRSGKKLYAGDYEFSYSTGFGCTSGSAATTIDIWSYPTGGDPLHTSAGLSSSNEPDGTAISVP